jgi:hypothetical protein
MARELFNSPEKKWIREHFWLPRLLDFKARLPPDIRFRYLTFAGPEGRDIECFTQGHRVFAIRDIRVWERSTESASLLRQKFGPELQIKEGEAFTLSSSFGEQQAPLFPYAVINLDFSDGFFNVRTRRAEPHKFEVIENIIRSQQRHACGFLLLLAFNVAPDVDNAEGQVFVHKMALDIATRYGATKALFNLTRGAKQNYSEVLGDLVPAAVIRAGGEHAFDTVCTGKAVYRPYGRRKSTMLCLSFEFLYDNPPLSQSRHFVSQRMEEVIGKRQEESLLVKVILVNERRKPRRIVVPKRTRAKYRTLSSGQRP